MDPRKNLKLEKKPLPCPVCNSDSFEGGYCSYDICRICRWQDDHNPIYNDPDEFVGGANRVTLNQAIENYKKYGFSETRFVKDQSIVEPRSCPVCNSPSFLGDHYSGEICPTCGWNDCYQAKFDSPDEVISVEHRGNGISLNEYIENYKYKKCMISKSESSDDE